MPDYVDDRDGIPDETELLRRIRPDVIVPDAKQASGFRLSSQAFEDSKDGTPCSVSVRHLAPPVAEICQRYPGYSVALITAQQARDQRQAVCLWPVEREPGHAYLAGPKTPAVRRALASAARYVEGPGNWG